MFILSVPLLVKRRLDKTKRFGPSHADFFVLKYIVRVMHTKKLFLVLPYQLFIGLNSA